MSEPVQKVSITGGTYFIGLMIWFLVCKSCSIETRLEEIRDRLPKAAESAAK